MSCEHEWRLTSAPGVMCCGRCSVVRPAPRLPSATPWTPERRESVGRAAWEAVRRRVTSVYSAEEVPWEQLPEDVRETYRILGEAAVRADEGGEG